MAPTPLNPDGATAAVATFEAVPIGQAFKDEYDAAVTAVRSMRVDASETVCPSTGLVPVTSESLADLNDFVSSMPYESTPDDLANLYGMALPGRHTGLCKAIAGPRGLRVVRAAAGVVAGRKGLRGADVDAYVAGEIRRFVDGLAGHQRETAPEAVAVLLVTLPGLEGRIAVCEAQHAAHVASELLRIEKETADANAAIAAVEQAQRETVATYFSARRGQGFFVAGNMLSGGALAELARRHGARNGEGEYASLTLAELIEAHRRALASDAVQQGGAQ